MHWKSPVAGAKPIMPRRQRQRKSGGKRVPEAHAKKIIPIDHATADAITHQGRLLREKFGREPGPEDPPFFSLVSSVPEFLNAESQEETWRALVQAAGESGMAPGSGLRDEQNGRIVTERNMRFLTDSDIQE
jgi:hypothetical protein